MSNVCGSQPFCGQPAVTYPGPWACQPLPGCLQAPSPIPVTFQAAASSNLVLSAGIDANVPFPFPLTSNPAFGPMTSIFQAPTAGTYFFTASVTWSSPSANKTLSLSLSAAGKKALTSTSLAPAVGTAQTATVSGILSLAAGQTVVVVANSSANSTILGAPPAPAAITWFAGSRA